MKLKPRKSDYGHMVIDCPFCSNFVYLREARKSSPDPLRDLKRHFTNQAKNEALAKATGDTQEMKHLDYFLAHTQPKVIQVKNKRQFDADMELADKN